MDVPHKQFYFFEELQASTQHLELIHQYGVTQSVSSTKRMGQQFTPLICTIFSCTVYTLILISMTTSSLQTQTC
ncbi:unnamed protein product [Paramecium sonneborni]|uniref:Uncharacterized protein n=1 Tax=Paramecium sonneborni TaxID=65129 RepID=A0A8S1QQS0_9CILI|nr:unnamed protein product [Paramecium sonneborni]